MNIESIDVKGGVSVLYLPRVCVSDWFDRLVDLDWVRIGSTPRSEYFVSHLGHPYTYGEGAGQRTYHPQPTTNAIEALWRSAEAYTTAALVDPDTSWDDTKFDVVFLNHYLDGKDQLGWHADDSPEMDDARPITIISLGATREIHFRDNVNQNVTKVTMHDGDMIVMPPGMQDTHQHRIPKSGLHKCGPRISLTFRGIDPNWKSQYV
jgi:alkylated DNA repair dioxygenase AlkB